MTRSPHHAVEHGMFLREQAGGTGGLPLLWVHGLGESGLCFERTVDLGPLAGHRHLIPDLPGYGRSAWPDAPPSLAGAADHLADWLASRGEDRVVVVGHSMGGVVALLMAERHPDRVHAVVDVDGNLSADDCVYSRPAARQPFADFVARGFDDLREEVYRAGDPAHRGYYASLRLADPRTFHAHAAELLALSAGEQLAARLASLRQPVLYVAGTPHGASRRSRALLGRTPVAVVEIAPAGHWPFIDRPDAFAEALARFLRTL